MTFAEEQKLALSIMGRKVTARGAIRSYTFIPFGTEIEPASENNREEDRLLIKVWWKSSYEDHWGQADVWIGHYRYEVIDA